MTVQGKTITVYDWFDIQKEICDVMGIAEENFRSYEKVVGGDYKDLWIVALHMEIPDQMGNDTIVKIYHEEYDEPFVVNPDEDWGWNKYIKENGDWVIPFIDAYNKVMFGLKGANDVVYVEFSW